MFFNNLSTPRVFFLICLQTPFQGNSIRVLFACRNQQSLKLYTGFFVPVNKIFTFCLLADHSVCLSRILGFDSRLAALSTCFEVFDCDQSSLRFYTGFFIPVKTNSKKSAFSPRPLSAGGTSLKRSFISRAIDYSTAFMAFR